MQQNDDCVFCKIIRGEIPAFKIYEDDQTFAFMDINPACEGHALIISKEHCKDLLEAPPDVLSMVAVSSQRIAKAIYKALQPDGMRVMQFNGEAAGQTVFHYHVHLRPAYQGQDLRSHGGGGSDMAQIEQVAEKIRAAF